MQLHRLKLTPQSAWMTAWQADTLFGLLCSTAAAVWGAERLQRDILEPALNGEPPFVLSDAFPGDLLPVPVALRLRDWGETDRKMIKRSRWLRPDDFRAVQRGETIEATALLPERTFQTVDRLRNQIGRLTDTTGEGGLFSCGETFLNTRFAALEGTPYLSVYLRIREDFRSALLGLFHCLAVRGFGADATTGKGAFVASDALEPAEWLEAETSTNGVVVLSTFQPAPQNPVNGFWEVFVKHGKVGPDLGLESVFKRPMVMLRPGACFHCEPVRQFLGRALAAREFLDEAVVRQLQAQNIAPIHAAFGLAVPITLPKEG